MTKHYDAIIIGTGQAAPALANRLSGAGMSVAVIERQFFGGTCVNTGCIPTKTMVASAYAARIAHRAADYGVVIDGNVRVDMKKVKARKDAIIRALAHRRRAVAARHASLRGLHRTRRIPTRTRNRGRRIRS